MADSSKSSGTRLQGKVAIVTGAASGIGAASAKLFAAQGARVVVADIQDELGQKVVSEIGGPDTARYVHCDVSRESEVQNAVDAAVDAFGQLDIMFNNAAILTAGPERPYHELEMSEFDRVMDVNVRGTVLCVKHAARVMVPRKSGVIVNVASAVAIRAGKLMPPYVVSKHAVVGITKSAAASLAEDHIRVNCISPFAVATPLYLKWIQSFNPDASMEDLERMFGEGSVLKGHQLKPEDIANAALYLASDEAAYVSGHNLVVDGAFTTTAK